MRKQHMTSRGWLSEDGVLDTQAAWLAAFDRATPPRLTYREAKLALYYLIQNGIGTSPVIAERLGISKNQASKMLQTVKREYVQGKAHTVTP